MTGAKSTRSKLRKAPEARLFTNEAIANVSLIAKRIVHSSVPLANRIRPSLGTWCATSAFPPLPLPSSLDASSYLSVHKSSEMELHKFENAQTTI